MRKYILMLILGASSFFATAGVTKSIQGKVLDVLTNEALIGATIKYGDTGVFADVDGSFFINVGSEGNLLVSFVGYVTQTIDVQNIPDDELLIIKLEGSSQILETATITGSKYQKRLGESTVSIDVIKPDFLKSNNTNSLDDALEKLPGVQVLDDNVSIRGGSGFSFGAGSRVMLLYNDIPYLQPDVGLASWGDVPIENISQVEILKGAGSALYGSAAMNGIINVRSAYATSDPVTEFSTSFIKYDEPKDKRKIWWNGIDTTFFESTTSLAHRRKIGKLDISASLFYKHSNEVAQENFSRKGRINLSTRYRATDRLIFGFDFNWNKSKGSDFLMWNNGVRGTYQPRPGTISSGNRLRYVIDPSISYYDKLGNRHKLVSRLYVLDNANAENTANASVNYYTEYQFQKNFQSINLNLSSGVVYANATSDSEILGDVGIFKSQNLGVYTQLDKKIANKLSLSAGLRYEYNQIITPSTPALDTIDKSLQTDARPVLRFGANYELAQGSFLRASWGQGYRFATIGERHLSTNAAGFTIFPNPVLRPESGWTGEVGIKQGFKLLGVEGYVDLAKFWQEYDDMMEFTFVSFDGLQGFQSQNVGNTSIDGWEGNIGLKGEWGEFTVRAGGGYTFIDPKYRDFDTNELIRNSLSDTVNVLKYRTKHNLKFDLQASYLGFSLGVFYEKTSHMINIDELLEIAGQIGEYREVNNQGYEVVNARAAYKFDDWLSLSILVNNLFNEEYTSRPGMMQPPRSFGVRVDSKF